MISPEFRNAYVTALGRHVRAGDEASLRDAYELGRRAVGEGCSALELAAIHHDALAPPLRSLSGDEAANVVALAAAFFQESLSAFEMLHRGYREAASAAAAERRDAAMLRRLSSFLADASLSAWQTETDAEVLHLVAENARELTGAVYASASWTAFDRGVRVRSMDAETPDATEILERLERLGETLPTRVSRAEWTTLPPLRGLPASNLLAVPLKSLDGEHVGMFQLLEKHTGDFTDADEAVALHLAEMTAAALERAQLYRETTRA